MSILVQLRSSELDLADIQFAQEILEFKKARVLDQDLRRVLAGKPSDEARTCARNLVQAMELPETQCPICDKQFQEGYYHPAEMKLWQHMGHGRSHRRMRQWMDWQEDWGEVVY